MKRHTLWSLALLGIGGTAFAQALPQSSPSPDWTTLSADAGARPATEGAPAPFQPAPTPPPPAPVTAPPLTPPPVASVPVPAIAIAEKMEDAPLATPGTAGAAIGDAVNTRLTSSVTGPVGLYKVLSAEPGTPGVLRLGITGQAFYNNNFPVLDANDGLEVGVLTAGFTPWRLLDVYLGTQISANESTGSHGTNPSFVSEMGDFWIGAKLGGLIAKGFLLGIDLRGAGYSGVGSNSVGAGAFLPTGIVTLDFDQMARFPLRFHLNFGGRFGDLTDIGVTNAAGQPIQLRAPEQFALGASSFDSELRLGAGVEFPLPYVTPFVEYNAIFPVGSNAGDLVGPDDAPVSYANALPSDLDVGARLTAFRDVSLFAGVDLSFQRNVALGVPILPPWEVAFGLTYNVDLFAKSKIVTLERPVVAATAPAAPATGQVDGTVVEEGTQAPVPGAVVEDGVSYAPVATDAAGHFRSYDLRAGPVQFSVTKLGYKPGTGQATVVAGQHATVQIALVKEAAQQAGLHVSAHSAGKPVAAQISVAGPNGFNQPLKLGDDGTGQVAVPGPGSYMLQVSADGYLTQVAKVDVAAGGAPSVDVEMVPAPKKTALIITEKKIRLKRQIHFENGQSTILPDSTVILEELASAILSRNIGKLRIEGHTDNKGGAAYNQKLSQDRADAVLQWLVEHGVPADRLEAVGYGGTKPIAPNLTSRGRALNRRVELDIL